MTNAEEIDRGMFILVNKEIFKVIRKEVIAVGTHSHSKTKLVCQNISGGGERFFTYSHKDRVEVPDIENRVGQVISVGEGSMSVMDLKNYETLEVGAGRDLLAEASEGKTVFFFTYNGTSKALKIE
jgi:translation initiation factor 5A